jgi:hypothetical protein
VRSRICRSNFEYERRTKFREAQAASLLFAAGCRKHSTWIRGVELRFRSAGCRTGQAGNLRSPEFSFRSLKPWMLFHCAKLQSSGERKYSVETGRRGFRASAPIRARSNPGNFSWPCAAKISTRIIFWNKLRKQARPPRWFRRNRRRICREISPSYAQPIRWLPIKISPPIIEKLFR